MFLTNASKHLRFLRPRHSRWCCWKTWLALFSGYSLQQGGHTVQRGYANEEKAGKPEKQAWPRSLLTFHGWVVWRLMSHTWHKVPYAAKRRSRIPMHPASVWMMGPSCIYGRTSRRQGEESRRERWKSNYFFFFFFFFFPLSRCLPSCVRQIRAGGKKLRRTVLRRATSWEVSEYESQTFALARCQRHSIHLSILDLSLSGRRYWSYFVSELLPAHTVWDLSPSKKIYVQRKAPFNVFNRNESRCVTALRNSCFGSIPLHLFPWLFCALRARCIEGFDV